MVTQDWLTDAVLYIYALSLLFFVSDAASGNRNARKVGTGLLVFVWVLQGAFLLVLLMERFSVPTLTLRDFLFVVSWLLVSASFILNRLMRAELLVLLVNVVGFAVLALNLIERPKRAMELEPWEVARRLLIVHVSLITLAFAVLTVTAILGVMYLFLHQRLKAKKWTHVMSRMPSLEWIDQYAYRAGLIGIPLLLLSLSTGTVALLIDKSPALLLDEKVLLSFAAGLLYIFYLIRRLASRDDGSKLAIWNLLGYLALVAGFFADSLSSFHQLL
ncbi:cytochrome c biogenesis protein CcsA [Cohnella cholangitidis]|uniref:Cytochrome C assembly protein n=1 Tax=Cohnella cholangitidis TaxID=2598458 RepID=A0A7G5C3L0_9BACL|nr:cytochrome c biogenesis protein CcsA [Cohnella cholangitidis]QMV43794.1 cytochrome C assembly protein [Cohnella cholangitidis]